MEWGEDEEYAQKSPAEAKRLYLVAHIEVRAGYNHCEYMIKKNADYVSGIENVIRKVLYESIQSACVGRAVYRTVRTVR